MPETKFVFARGFIAVIPEPDDSMSIRLNSFDINYSLLIFNSHFGNPNNQVAYLVPTQVMESFLKSCTTPAEDFVGFGSNSKDAGVLTKPEDLKTLPGGEFILPIGDPKHIFGGIVGDSFKPWLKIQEQLVEHNKKIKAWDEWFWSNGKKNIKIDGKSYKFSSVDEYKLHDEASELLARQQELISKDPKRSSTIDDKVISVTHLLLDKLDLFRVALANWHKGLTAGREDGKIEVEEEEIAPDDDGENDPVINSAGARMLYQALAFHKLNEQGVTHKNKFPILVIADTFAAMEAPDLSGEKHFYLDTFDMLLHTPKGNIQISTDELQWDDLLFWNEKVLPLAQDAARDFKDFRFLSRQAVTLE